MKLSQTVSPLALVHIEHIHCTACAVNSTGFQVVSQVVVLVGEVHTVSEGLFPRSGET